MFYIMIKDLLSKVSAIYWRYIASAESYARHIGVTIGKNCLISTRNWPSEPYLINIGDNVQLTQGVSIYTHGGGNAIRKEHPDFDVFGKVIIENWAYIGAFSQIMPGVTIGEGALVAAGSVVTKSVQPHAVVGGNPARYICNTDEYYEKNKAFNLGTSGLSERMKKDYLMKLSNDKFIKK